MYSTVAGSCGGDRVGLNWHKSWEKSRNKSSDIEIFGNLEQTQNKHFITNLVEISLLSLKIHQHFGIFGIKFDVVEQI